MGKHFEKQTKVVLGKYKRANILKKKQMQFLEIELKKKYGHGQTLNFKKKQMQFGETRTDKHFEKQQNAVWTNICSFLSIFIAIVCL